MAAFKLRGNFVTYESIHTSVQFMLTAFSSNMTRFSKTKKNLLLSICIFFLIRKSFGYNYEYLGSCPYYFSEKTNSATISYDACYIPIPVCPGETLVIGSCGTVSSSATCAGDQYLRLFDGGSPYSNEVAFDDDGCGWNRCSQIIYTVPRWTTCKTYYIHEGCYGNSKCGAVVEVYKIPGPPTAKPSFKPTTVPSLQPSKKPSIKPSAAPSTKPSAIPSTAPSWLPTKSPSIKPSAAPSTKPSAIPSTAPSWLLTKSPSIKPSASPSMKPSAIPSTAPSWLPTKRPSIKPSASPSTKPSAIPSTAPSWLPTKTPSIKPSASPSAQPSKMSSVSPSLLPTKMPTGAVYSYIGSCPYYSAEYTDSATSSYYTCYIPIPVCPGETLVIGSCGTVSSSATCAGDQYLRLFDGGSRYSNEVAFDDDGCGLNQCSQITLTIPGWEACKTYYIREGCYGNTPCSAVVEVYKIPGPPTAKPSFKPTTVPTASPSAQLSESPDAGVNIIVTASVPNKGDEGPSSLVVVSLIVGIVVGVGTVIYGGVRLYCKYLRRIDVTLP